MAKKENKDKSNILTALALVLMAIVMCLCVYHYIVDDTVEPEVETNVEEGGTIEVPTYPVDQI